MQKDNHPPVAAENAPTPPWRSVSPWGKLYVNVALSAVIANSLLVPKLVSSGLIPYNVAVFLTGLWPKYSTNLSKSWLSLGFGTTIYIRSQLASLSAR